MSDQKLVKYVRKPKPAPDPPPVAAEPIEQEDSAALVIIEPEPLAFPTMALPIAQNPAAAYLLSLGSEKSRATMRSALGSVVCELNGKPPPGERPDIEHFPWHSLRYPHVSALRARFAERLAPASVNLILAALRGVFRECRKLKLMSAEDVFEACTVKGVRGSRAQKGRALGKSEISGLFEACDTTPRGVRDRAILGLLYGCGLRRAEAAALERQSVDLGATPATARVIGKGNKERIAKLPPGTADNLRAWLAIRGNHPGPLFMDLHHGGDLLGPALCDRSIANILDALVKRAAITKTTTPHDMRRTFISNLLDNGIDISTAQRMAGHSNVATTQQYDRRDERAEQSAAMAIDVPGPKRKA